MAPPILIIELVPLSRNMVQAIFELINIMGD